MRSLRRRWVLMALFGLMSVIMLVNLLVAMFTSCYEEVSESVRRTAPTACARSLRSAPGPPQPAS